MIQDVNRYELNSNCRAAAMKRTAVWGVVASPIFGDTRARHAGVPVLGVLYS